MANYLIVHLVLSTFLLGCLNAQSPVGLGRFVSLAHGVKSGDVTILDEKTIKIKDFSYDGKGPAGWFVLGKGEDYKKERVVLKGITVIPDEDGSCDKLKKYNSKTITLTLPGKWRFKDFDYLSAYCLEYSHTFGYVTIPKNLNLATAAETELKECKTKWNSSGSMIRPLVSSSILGLAFGFFSALNLFPIG